MSAAPLRIACVHATPRSIGPARRMLQAEWPGLAAEDFLEERLLALTEDREASFHLFLKTIRRAQASAPDAILTTCSIFNRDLPRIRELVETPLLGVDEPMIERAAEIGGRLALVGSIASAIENTGARIKGLCSRDCEIVPAPLVDKDACADEAGARALAEELRRLREQADAVVVVQLSLARTSEFLSDAERATILSSAAPAIARLRTMIAASRSAVG